MAAEKIPPPRALGVGMTALPLLPFTYFFSAGSDLMYIHTARISSSVI
jgi:hypothetical protein